MEHPAPLVGTVTFLQSPKKGSKKHLPNHDFFFYAGVILYTKAGFSYGDIFGILGSFGLCGFVVFFIFRFSRSLWLNFFLKYDAEAKCVKKEL